MRMLLLVLFYHILLMPGHGVAEQYSLLPEVASKQLNSTIVQFGQRTLTYYGTRAGRVDETSKTTVPLTGTGLLSLLWDKNSSVEQSLTQTKFPLEPGLVGVRYQWKASEQMPLLVYDPAHLGQISRAQQLFGHWTRGGKRRISRGTVWNMIPWNTGYEALATFDGNGDHQISGTELASLGLWFDKNSDGISQQGEVRSLPTVGVERLYYVDPIFDESTLTFTLPLGYERRVGGRIQQLPSIEWRGKPLRSW